MKQRGSLIAWVAFLGLPLMALSCEDNRCPPDQIVGEVSLKSASRDALPSTTAGKVVFVDSMQNQLSFETDGLETKPDSIVIAIPCAGNIFTGATYHYLLGEEWTLTYTSLPDGALTIRYRVYTDDTNLSFEDSTLVDYVTASISSSSTFTTSVWAYASDRGHNDSVNVDDYKSEVTLLGKTYTDVFYKTFDRSILIDRPDILVTELYYSKVEGIVAFKTRDDGYWVLK